MWTRPVSFIHARVHAREGTATTLRCAARILSIGEAPHRGDIVVDLRGSWILPGLINAHDHLELNHYGRQKSRATHANVSEWIADMQPRLRADPVIRAGSAHPLADRVFAGALKNLLSGVTTVAHHNPWYREIRRASPIRVVRRYGWAHSFGLEERPAGARGEPGGSVHSRFLATPKGAPFIVHLAEGVDDDARAECARLDALGGLAPHTVLVHGVGIDEAGWARVRATDTGVVWCPASNEFLFGAAGTSPIWTRLGSRPPENVALGTDSRLTGARDLLEELRVAANSAALEPAALLRMVTTVPARLLRLPNAGTLAVSMPADLCVIPASSDSPALSLLAAARSDVQLVMLGGRPLVGSRAMAPVFQARRVATREIVVDDVARLADRALAQRIASSPIAEPGVSA